VPKEVAKGLRIRYTAERRKKWSVALLCRVLDISESGYYKHVRNQDRPCKHAELLAQIYDLLREDEENANYGIRRIFDYLRLNKGYMGS